MNDINIRGKLEKLRNAIANKRVKIGFAGGSITTASAANNWPVHIRGWFTDTFKDTRLSVVNAAIGATGSLCGLTLVQEEFIDKNCDLVFVEYAVNDDRVDKEERMRTREGLIRKLLAAGIDVVLVYTFYKEMYPESSKGEVPQSIADLEAIAKHYNISSVYMANFAYDKVKHGMIPWNIWLPDGTHPGQLASWFYAQGVISFLEQELKRNDETKIMCGDMMPEPINANNWQYTEEIPFDKVKTVGAWAEMNEVMLAWFSDMLYTCGLNDSLSFDFYGRGLAIIFNYGKSTGLIEYSIDGGEWKEYACERYWWMPEENFVNTVKFADDLELGSHNFRMRVNFSDQEGFTSSDCKILKIVAVK